MNNSRDFILEKAFGQYLEHGYENVSISVLQNSINLGRATIYYHFSNKESLFKEVVNEYIVKPIYSFLQKTDEANANIPELINFYAEKNEQIISLVKAVNPQLKITHYLSLMLHAYAHDKEFCRFIDNSKERLFSLWLRAVQKSLQEGDLMEETDAERLASLFCGLNEFSPWDKSTEECLATNGSFIQNCQHLYFLFRKQKN
ncbi:MAG: TetR/AcrR family transcriptional regulator [Paludibacteraceae bacterium]|nr:TetR/AcrR family transcriptional regulator [Paludibacteraceae bacterium]